MFGLFRRKNRNAEPVDNKDIEEVFGFLVNDYGLNYSLQKYNNCHGGYWYVEMHCFYNENGCFSIYNLCQRGEWDYYYAQEHSKNMDKLMVKHIDIYSVEKEIWEEPLNIIKELGKEMMNCRNTKGLFHIGYKQERLELETLSKVIKSQIDKHGCFYGLKVK